MNRLLLSLYKIYRKPAYIAISVGTFFAYYFLVSFVIKHNNKFLVMGKHTAYLLFLLEVTASLLIASSLFSAAKRRVGKAKGAGIATATTVFGSLTVGCGCTSPILFGITSIFVGSSAVVADAFISRNQVYIISAMILINLLLTIYYLNKISKGTCKIG